MLMLTAMLQAQAPGGFAAFAGLNATSFESDDLLAEGGMGYRAGVVFLCGYHETYNYQFEFAYNQSKLNLLAVDSNYNRIADSKYNYTSTEVGLYLNYYILVPEEDAFFLGPQLGGTFYIGNTLEPAGGGNTENENYLPYLLDENQLQDINKINYSAGLGVTGGYNNFRFDLRYNLGLSNVLKGVQTNSYDESNLYNGPTLEGKMNMFTFSINYRFLTLFGN